MQKLRLSRIDSTIESPKKVQLIITGPLIKTEGGFEFEVKEIRN